jgi:hypothetical protein
MRKAPTIILGCLFLPALGFAQSAFNGTWRPDPQKPAHEKPEVIVLTHGDYECQSCTPPYKVKADGHDQPVAGNPYFDSIMITVIDDRTVAKTAKRGGTVSVYSKETVAADGAAKIEVQTLIGMAPAPIELTAKFARVSAGAAGTHPISGTWQMTEMDVSNHAEDTTFKVSGGALSMTDRMGRSFTAKFDGTQAPYQGSDEFDHVSLKLIDERTIEESDLKNGKVTKISRWALAPDGRTIHARFDDRHGHIQEQDGHKVQ